jgi:hypothetical protein
VSRVANNVALAGEQQMNDLVSHQNIVVTVPGNTRFYIVLAKPSGSVSPGAATNGPVPASNPGGYRELRRWTCAECSRTAGTVGTEAGVDADVSAAAEDANRASPA